MTTLPLSVSQHIIENHDPIALVRQSQGEKIVCPSTSFDFSYPSH